VVASVVEVLEAAVSEVVASEEVAIGEAHQVLDLDLLEDHHLVVQELSDLLVEVLEGIITMEDMEAIMGDMAAMVMVGDGVIDPGMDVATGFGVDLTVPGIIHQFILVVDSFYLFSCYY